MIVFTIPLALNYEWLDSDVSLVTSWSSTVLSVTSHIWNHRHMSSVAPRVLHRPYKFARRIYSVVAYTIHVSSSNVYISPIR